MIFNTLNHVKAGTSGAVEFLSLTNKCFWLSKFSDWVLIKGLIVKTNFNPVWLEKKYNISYKLKKNMEIFDDSYLIICKVSSILGKLTLSNLKSPIFFCQWWSKSKNPLFSLEFDLKCK